MPPPPHVYAQALLEHIAEQYGETLGGGAAGSMYLTGLGYSNEGEWRVML